MVIIKSFHILVDALYFRRNKFSRELKIVNLKGLKIEDHDDILTVIDGSADAAEFD
jgi:hypothetical protein